MRVSEVRWAAPGWRTRGAVRRWALSASLLLNVFLIAHAMAPVFHPARPRGFDGMVDHFAHNLPAADADRFRNVLDQERPAFEAQRREMDRARTELSRAIARDPYDPAAARARMSEWQAQLQGMSGRIGDTLLSVAPLLSPEGRAKLADAADHPPGPPAPPDASRGASGETPPHP